MQLTERIDLSKQAVRGPTDIPCQESDAALWFAQSPADVELAKALSGRCPVVVGPMSDRQPSIATVTILMLQGVGKASRGWSDSWGICSTPSFEGSFIMSFHQVQGGDTRCSS